MATTVQASEGYSIVLNKLLWTFGDGTVSIASLSSFGGGAGGAALDTLASAHGGLVKITEMVESS